LPLIQYLSQAENQPLTALLALTIIGFTVTYGAAFFVGRAGIEIGFVLNLAPLLRRSLAIGLGALTGLLIGSASGAFVGKVYGVGPDPLLLGLLGFFGLTIGTFLGGMRRESITRVDPETDQVIDKIEGIVTERIRWMVWHYTSLEVVQALAVAIAIVIGTVAGGLIVFFYPDGKPEGLGGIAWAGMGLALGAILGGMGCLLANPYGRLHAILTGMIVGLATGTALGVLLVALAHSSGTYMLPGLVYGGTGGMCFGMLGGDPSRTRRPEE
jgi:hypothetical protein